MKRLILVLALFPLFLYPQSGKSVLSERQKDTVNTLIDTMIKDSVMTWDDMVDSLGYRTFEYYGAVGDGVTNDSAAVVNALGSGYPIKGRSGTTYLVSNVSPIYITGKDIDLSSTGLEPFTLKFDQLINYSTGASLYFRGTQKTTGNLLKDSLSVSSKKLTFTTVANVDTGDLVLLLSPTGDYWQGIDTADHDVKCDLHLVERIDGDTVYTLVPAFDTYDGTSNSHPATVYVYEPITVKMKNVKFEFIGTTSTSEVKMLQIQYSKYDVIEDVEINNARVEALGMWFSYGSQINRLKVAYSDYIGLGYATDLIGCFDVSITNSTFRNCRSPLDGGTYISRNNHVAYNIISNDEYISFSGGFGCHPQSEGWTFEGNKVNYAYNGALISGIGHTIKNNTFYNTFADVILIGTGNNITIDGNIVNSFVADSSITPARLAADFVYSGYDFGSTEKSSMIITNNKVNSISTWFLRTENNLYNLTLANNDISFTALTAYLIQNAGTDTIWNANIHNNNIIRNRDNTTNYLTHLTDSITFINSNIQFRDKNSTSTTVYNGLDVLGNFTGGGVDLDSLAFFSENWNVTEDTSLTTLITNGACEGVYVANLAPNLVKYGDDIVVSEEVGGDATKAQGFTSITATPQSGIIFKASDTVNDSVLYRLTFDARRISGTDVDKLYIYINGTGYLTTINPVTVTDTWATYTYPFTAQTALSTGNNFIYFGIYGYDYTSVFAVDNVIVRPLEYLRYVGTLPMDSVITFEPIDSLPYQPSTAVKIGNIGGELSAKDTSGNVFILTNFPPVTIPSDSTGLPTGAFYYRSSDGILRRKY